MDARQALLAAYREVERAWEQFQDAVDPDAVDAAIADLQAAEARVRLARKAVMGHGADGSVA
ncbi:MAG: hypothetical protein K6U87_09840 [Firmicutes bacterium]|nr:hypothetical protein [Bacillota bacterium]